MTYLVEINLSGLVCVLKVVTRCEDIHHTLGQIHQALTKRLIRSFTVSGSKAAIRHE
jgi:hypothetical protein